MTTIPRLNISVPGMTSGNFSRERARQRKSENMLAAMLLLVGEEKTWKILRRRQIKLALPTDPKIIEQLSVLQAATVRALPSRPRTLCKPSRSCRIAKLSRGVIRFVPVWHWTVAQIPEPQPAFVFQSRNCQDNPLSWATLPSVTKNNSKHRANFMRETVRRAERLGKCGRLGSAGGARGTLWEL